MPVSAGIFLNYRREDASHAAARLCDQLLKHFGPEAIFMDIDSVPVGKDFTESIANALDACSVFLAIIGSTWVNVKDSMGNRRLNDPNDYVRLEIQAALRRGIPVIPVLIDNAGLPNPLELPESLRPLFALEWATPATREFPHRY